jgi:hypothetical protein
MCYDEKTSITTYIIGSTSSIYLLLSKNINFKIEGGFFLFVSQMQLIEYLLWKHKVICDQYNINISNIGSILNHSQPIVLYGLIRYFNKKLINLETNKSINLETNKSINLETNKNTILNILISIYIICLITYSKDAYPIGCTTIDNKNHLYWKWNYKQGHVIFYTIFVLTLVLLNYYGLENPYNIVFALFFLISYMYSFYKYKDTKAIGAVWCWIAALFPLFIVAYDLLLKIDN